MKRKHHQAADLFDGDSFQLESASAPAAAPVQIEEPAKPAKPSGPELFPSQIITSRAPSLADLAAGRYNTACNL